MPTRTARATWEGSVTDGKGTVSVESGVLESPYSLPSRANEGTSSETNSEELLAAAHAACFSMALSGVLTKAGTPPESIQTSARVTIVKTDAGLKITTSELTTKARVPGIDAAGFQEAAEEAKTNCPVSKALAGVEISLEATLES